MNTGTASWVYTSTLVYQNAVTPTKDLVESGGGFVVEGGGNLACSLESSVCGDTTHAKRIFYWALFSNFPSWVAMKASLLPRYACAEYSPGELVVPTSPITSF